MSEILDFALQYAARGWQVLPLSQKKKALVKWKEGQCEATTDPSTIEAWWTGRFRRANLGILTGPRSGIVVVDIDGPKGFALLAKYGRLPPTLVATSGREDGGVHAYYRCSERFGGIILDGLEIKAHGQLVVAPPSRHASGRIYRWRDPGAAIADFPMPFLAWMQEQKRTGQGRRSKRKPETPNPLGERPTYLDEAANLTERAQVPTGDLGRRGAYEDVLECLELIENHDLPYDDWKETGMAVWAALEGSNEGFELFEGWSTTSSKWKEGGAEQAWHEITGCPPTKLGMQSLIGRARDASGLPDWLPSSRSARPAQPPNEPAAAEAPEDSSESSQETEFTKEHMNGHTFAPHETDIAASSGNPLIDLNKRYSVIGDLGGKCLVMSWVPSKVDDAVKVPSFQTFKSFSERYANQYVKIGAGDEAEIKQVGPYWLKWTKRKSYEGIDLVPNGAALLPGNVLNLWSGFAIEPARGAWPLMQQHIGQVLAAGDREAAWYITRFAAWAVQHPGERAEVALVFRGDKGSGKGTFANALRRIFGQHGLHIFNSKHLVGAFNGHLRNCLLLFADEAFWAGDKQGESVLKGLITEPALMIEQKGVDAAPWRNRLHVIMAANADWVVPAGRHERRYAVFDVAPDRIDDRAYFRALYAEMREGGLAAMLWDLLHLDLGEWHPREVIKTEALRQQKELSLPPLQAWWEHILQEGKIPYHLPTYPRKAKTSSLVNHARETFGQIREVNGVALGRYLKTIGAEGRHEADGNYWLFPTLKAAREMWVRKMGAWPWRTQQDEWLV